MVAFPALSVLLNRWSQPGRSDWAPVVLLPFTALWVLDFAYNKIIGAMLLICAIAVIASPKISGREKLVTSAAAVVVCIGLWLWMTTIHF